MLLPIHPFKKNNGTLKHPSSSSVFIIYMDDVITLTTAMADRNNTIADTIKTYGKRLLGFIKQRVTVNEDAEDIMQDVLYQFVGNADSIEETGSWLFKVARNRITDNYRKHKLPLAEDIFPPADEDEGFDWKELILSREDTLETAFLRNIFWEELQAALEELPAEQRDVFVMNEIDGVPFKDLSEQTSISVPTLISRKRYAVLHLRKRLAVLRDELMGY